MVLPNLCHTHAKKIINPHFRDPSEQGFLRFSELGSPDYTDTDEEPSQSLLAVAKAEEKAFMDVKRHKMVNGVFSWNLSLDIDNI